MISKDPDYLEKHPGYATMLLQWWHKDLKYDPTNPHYLTKAENCLHEDITGNVKLIESIFKAPDPLKQSLLKSGNIKQSRIVKVSPKAT